MANETTKTKRILLKKSSMLNEEGTGPKLPTKEQLVFGEVAVNYAAGNETFSIKNSADEVVPLSFSVQPLAEALAMHEARNDNPHGVTKAQVGLGNVDNTADVDKPVSTAQQAELDKKLGNAANGGIANDLTTNDATKALSAAQGIALNEKISNMTGGAIENLQSLENRVAAVEQEINAGTAYIDGTLKPKSESLLLLTV